MSGKLEKTELEKQQTIGCMNGMFHRLVARRLTNTGRDTDTDTDNNALPPPSDRAILSSGTQREEDYKPKVSPQTISEYSPRKNSDENQRVSIESSLSSSPNNKIKTTNSKVETKTVRSDTQLIMKDSIDGQTRGLSVKSSDRDEVKKKDNLLKYYRDSPRPTTTLPADFSLSSTFLARLKEAPRNLSEAPRFSCDGREMSQTKPTRIREVVVPRLSLDSRDQSSLPSPNQRAPSVIAKLMGLEAMPTSSESQETTVTSVEKETSKDTDTRSRCSSSTNETVYVQRERRVRELDSQESNKDLRALKHILGTMQAKGLLETKKSNEQLAKVQTPQVTPPPPPRAFESPIVIMKPAKSVNRLEELEGLSGLRKLRTSTSGVASRKQVRDEAILRDTTGHEKKQTPAMQRSPRPQQAAAREGSVSPVKASSLTVQQRKTEPVKKPRTTTRQPASRQQQLGPMSPGLKNRAKPNRAEYDQRYKLVDEISRSEDGNAKMHKKSLWIASEEVSMAETTLLLPSEQPSPISVLDASFYYEESLPSPVKTISTSVEDDEVPTSTKDYEIPTIPRETLPPKPSPEVDSWELGNIKSLVQKLKQLSSIDGGESQEPVLDYVLEMLLASGGHGESTLARAKPEKLRHKLMLDVVQDILIQKLEVVSHGPQSDLFVRAKKFGGQLLLRELCSEIKWMLAGRPRATSLDDVEAMSADDLLPPRSEGWEDFGLEVPCLVLEIERSIFKGLIDEVVTGEANSDLLTLRRRQLFT